ncbi:MAG: SEC-C metal-binding domain-containing protein [Rhodanobacter sp.]
MLADFGERTFLKLWSHANPYKDDGHEMCDLIAVFGDEIFVFFDREIVIAGDDDMDLDIAWGRWKRKAIDKQINTAHGAERYIRMGRPSYLDAKKEHPLPFEIDVNNAKIHKIIVAHGAKEACKKASSDNVYGSLAITYEDCDNNDPDPFPFHVRLDRNNPVHILDSHNLAIILSELDTITDLSRFLNEKVRAITQYDMLSYCGEEDLLGHYLANFDSSLNRHVIGPQDRSDINCVMIGEGEWRDFIDTDVYKNTKAANKVSYGWDELIQRTCQNAIDGTLLGNGNLWTKQSAIFDMVKEPRFMRRGLFERMLEVISKFPDRPIGLMRQVTLLPSYTKNIAYVFLQLCAPTDLKARPDYREKRQAMLEIACGSAKNKFQELTRIIGIGIDAPKHSDGNDGEDFVLMPCETWTDEMRVHYEVANKDLKFFETPQMREHRQVVHEFVNPEPTTAIQPPTKKVGRNEPCPCGSGVKFKKCHGAPTPRMEE